LILRSLWVRPERGERPHPENRHFSLVCTSRNLASGHGSTLASLAQRNLSDASFRVGGNRGALAREPRKVKIMPLIQLLEVLIVVGVLLWLVNRFIPMQGTIKSILNGVVVIAVVLWLLNVFGLFHSLSRIHVGT
jgi:hypothetical protein